MSTAFVRPERSQSSRRSSASLPKSSGTASQQRGTAAGRDNGRGDRSRSRDASSHAAPRRLARTEREAEILEAAFTEFAARGYAATRLEDVARRAGVAKGLPHFYFERKEDLFRAVLRRFIVPPWVDLIETAAAAEGPTRDVLRATLALMYERLAVNERYREVIRLLIAEGQRFPELTMLYYTEVMERMINVFRRLVMRGIERGEFRAGPVLNNPQVIHGPVNMAMIWQLVFGEHHSLDLSSWCEAHVDLVLNGLEQTQGETG